MAELNSLTEVTKKEIEEAVNNWKEQREKDKEEYLRRVQDWKDNYKFSWWQRHVGKMYLLGAEELLEAVHGEHYLLSGYKYISDYKKVELGLWDDGFSYTLGNYGRAWCEVALQLNKTKKESHLVGVQVLGWIIEWKNHND